jgi:hypothetical protein
MSYLQGCQRVVSWRPRSYGQRIVMPDSADQNQ